MSRGRVAFHQVFPGLGAVSIPELSEQESDTLLAMLFNHAYQPEFQCRFSWEDDSIAMWDNRCLQHRGINDFSPAYRHMHRVAVIETRRPATNPEQQTPLSFDPKLAYVDVADLYEIKPEISYTDGSYDNTENNLAAADNSGDDDTEVDAKFLSKLNSKKIGFTFTSGAAAQVKKIPAMFRGAALRSIYKAAEEQGMTEINVALLAEVNRKRKG